MVHAGVEGAGHELCRWHAVNCWDLESGALKALGARAPQGMAELNGAVRR